MALISIIMPTYNRAHVIGRAVRSVLSQNYRLWELLIVDDGSSDNTKNTVEPFLLDRRVRYFFRSHRGVSTARNFGLFSSQGDIITYLDTDNVWYPNYLETVAAAYYERPLVSCAYAALDVENAATGETTVQRRSFDRNELVEQNYIDLNVFSHRRSLFAGLGGFDERMTRFVDWDLILKYTEHNPPLEIAVIGGLYTSTERNRITVDEGVERNIAIVRSNWG